MMLQAGAFFALLLAAAREGLRQGGADRFTRQAGLALIALAARRLRDRLPDGRRRRLAARPGAHRRGAAAAPAGRTAWGTSRSASSPPSPPPRRWRGCRSPPSWCWSSGRAAPCERRGERRPALGRRSTRRSGPACRPRRWSSPGWAGRSTITSSWPSTPAPSPPPRAPAILAAVLEALQTPAWHGFLWAMFLPPLLLLHRRARPFAVVATLQLAASTSTSISPRRRRSRPALFLLSNFARLGFQLVPASLVVALVAWGRRETRT